MTKQDKFEYINLHRQAVGRIPFKRLTDDQIKKHMKLINKHSKYGNDPWEKN